MTKTQKQQILPIRHKTQTYYRSADQVNLLIEQLKSQFITFKVHQSQYSTVLEVDNRKTRYVTQVYDDNVFRCSSMIKGNLNKSEAAQQLIQKNFSTINYNVCAGLPEGKYGKVVNIDISGAYPQALINNNLIENKTYRYLMDLDKKQRLPAIGMIAKKSMVYFYEYGILQECTEVSGKYTKIFQYIVQEINDLMNECIKIAGSYYIMHWVDGIFLKRLTPVYIIKQIEELIKSKSYKLKFEKIDSFNLKRDGVFIEIQMRKNGLDKNLKFADQNMITLQNTITGLLNGDLSELHGNTARNLQPPERVSSFDWEEWFS